MARLLVHVEGQTEEAFVNQILRDYLRPCGYEAVSARIVGKARSRRRRGGIRSWPSVKKEIINHLKEDPSCIATTMVDYYALPSEGEAAWPGRKEAMSLISIENALKVERAMLDEVGAHINPRRFMPFIVMHEFEGLLFSDCTAFSRGIGRPGLQDAFQNIRNQFPTPEDIDDSPLTAPSKRVEELVPGYEKPLLGSLAALEIGLSRIRQECPHFNEWVKQLEDRAGID